HTSMCYNRLICLNDFSGGFSLNRTELNMDSWKFRTDNSSAAFTGQLSFENVDSLLAFAESTELDLDFDGAYFDPGELRLITQWYRLNVPVVLSGHISGTPELLRGENFEIKVGDNTGLKGNWRLLELADSTNRSIAVNVEKLYSDRNFV